MDKKNTIIGALLIAAAFACYFISARYAPPSTSPAAIRRAVVQQTAAAGLPAPVPGAQTAFASAVDDHAGATVTRLENDFIQVRFTNFGGAIRDVALKKYPAALNRPDPFIFNELHKDPMLAFVDFPGLDRGTRFELVSKTATEVVFRTVLDGRLEITRRYVLSPDKVGTTDPYQIHHETVFRNLTAKASAPVRVLLGLGTAAPLNPLDTGLYLTTGYSNGSSQTFTRRGQLEASGGILGMRAHDAVPEIESGGPVAWTSVSSQFFASVLTPGEPAAGLVTRRVKLLSRLPDTDSHAYGITGDAEFDLNEIPPHGESKLSAEFYVGPKEYHRLSNEDVFKANQEKVMQYGGWFISFFSGLLITLMTWTHSFVHNWGLAIICTTLIPKFACLPLTLISARSARRMQKIQPELKALREKFKDNPQKQQAATMELFKQHKVNPMGGCIPMLITMPFFFGFYTMLRSTAELRFAPFLWAHDLSAPDTVGHILGYSINILPILFTRDLVHADAHHAAADGGQLPGADDEVHAPCLHVHILHLFLLPLPLFHRQRPLFHRPAARHQPKEGRRRSGPWRRRRGHSKAGGKPMKNVTPRRKS